MPNTRAENLASHFFFYGLASLARSVAFRAMAPAQASSKDTILAVMSGYYHLFHLSISMLYFCPQYIPADLLQRLMKAKDGRDDPTPKIRHGDLSSFFAKNQADAFPPALPALFEEGRTLRIGVNYAPRVIRTGPVDFHFASCRYNIADAQAFLAKLPNALHDAFQWMDTRSPQHISRIALTKLPDFFTKKEMFYPEWCSPTTVEDALAIVQDLSASFLPASNLSTSPTAA